LKILERIQIKTDVKTEIEIEKDTKSEDEKNSMKGKYIALIVLASLVTYGIFFFGGNIISFRMKVNYLSERYPTFECKIAWKDWPTWDESHTKGDYNLSKASSWTAFKSLLIDAKNEGSFLDTIFYEPSSRVIWFDKLEAQGYNRPFLTTTVYYRVSTPW